MYIYINNNIIHTYQYIKHMWNNCWANPHYDISWPLSKQLFSSSSHFTSTSAALVVAEILYQPVVTMVVHLRSVGSMMMPVIGKSTSKTSDSNTTVFMYEHIHRSWPRWMLCKAFKKHKLCSSWRVPKAYLARIAKSFADFCTCFSLVITPHNMPVSILCLHCYTCAVTHW